MGPAIAEEDQDDLSEADGGAIRFRIKNLDTGEEQEIENEEQEELLDKKLSEGRHSNNQSIQKSKISSLIGKIFGSMSTKIMNNLGSIVKAVSMMKPE